MDKELQPMEDNLQEIDQINPEYLFKDFDAYFEKEEKRRSWEKSIVEFLATKEIKFTFLEEKEDFNFDTYELIMENLPTKV